jgi:hypothetical protein
VYIRLVLSTLASEVQGHVWKDENLPAPSNTDRFYKGVEREGWRVGIHPRFGLQTKLLVHSRGRLQFAYTKNDGRSRKGTPAEGIIPTVKGKSITLGAISQADVIDVSLQKGQAVSGPRSEKVNDTTATVINGRVGTRTEHFLTYISNVMDVLNRHGMKGNLPGDE